MSRNGSGSRLVVVGGSKINASATFASDRNNAAGVKSYNKIEVKGADSKISSKYFVVGR